MRIEKIEMEINSQGGASGRCLIRFFYPIRDTDFPPIEINYLFSSNLSSPHLHECIFSDNNQLDHYDCQILKEKIEERYYQELKAMADSEKPPSLH